MPAVIITDRSAEKALPTRHPLEDTPPERPPAWRLVKRVDRTKPSTFLTPGRCQRCNRCLRFVDLLADGDGARLAVGRQCSRKLRTGGDRA
jgi:hypothetical protein